MSLATRCPACQTVFRVVQDQLRVSEGWVRCGRCAEVFNALEHMVEVVKPTLPPAMPLALGDPAVDGPVPRAVGPAPIAPQPALPAGTPDLSDLPPPPQGGTTIPPMSFAPLPDPAHALDLEPRLPAGVVAAHEELYEERRGDGLAQGTGDAQARDRASAAEAAFDMPAATAAEAAHEREHGYAPGLAPDPLDFVPAHDAGRVGVPGEVAAIAAAVPAATAPSPAPVATAAGADDPAPMPGFLRRAESAARWQRPAVRRALAALLVVGLAGLAVQTTLAYRDLLASRWPATRVVLAPLCEALGCRIEQPRWIDAVVVDSTGLTKVEGSAYRLSVVMRNRSPMALALPAVDLMLTDTQGRLVARRTLTARELGATAAALPAQGELALQATLQVTGATVAGYTIEVFYP